MADRTEQAGDTASYAWQEAEVQQALENDVLHPAGQPAESTRSDRWAYGTIVAVLGFTVVMVVLGAILMATFDRQIPDTLIALGSASVGILIGLLAPSPRHSP